MYFLVFVLLLLTSSPVAAQDMCIDQCLPVPCKKTADNDCSKPKYTCTKKPCAEVYSQTQEGEAEAGPVSSVGFYGAIAHDKKTGATGFSGRSVDAATAQSVALQQCKGKCVIVASFVNSCFAIAKNQKGAAGWGVNTEKAVARKEAMEKCIGHSTEESHTCVAVEQRCYVQD